LELAFLGTGAAFSLERYNGAIVVERRLLLDAGAPLLPHMHRLGIDPGQIEAVLLTHFHGDHVLGLPPFLLHRSFLDPRPLTVLGPAGVEARVDALCRLAWGEEWPDFRARFPLHFEEAGTVGSVAGWDYETVALQHGLAGGMGYRLRLAGRLLAYSGDAEPTAALDSLVEGADVAIVEATGPGEPVSHTGWEAAAALANRHPGTRFLFNHVYSGSLEGAAGDLEVLTV
jgi:ribonuclease BN (tRNA processing enzyme)